jgi:ATP-dependent RNA/DNA helicase IGHMBP2
VDPPFEEVLQGHIAALVDALRREEDAQRAQLRMQLQLPHADRMALGVSWPVGVVADQRPRGRNWILELRAPKGAVFHPGISSGDRVMLGSPSSPGRGVEGRVLGVHGGVAELRARAEVGERVAVTLRFDPSSFTKLHGALARVRGFDTPLARALLHGPQPLDEVPTRALHGLNLAQTAAASLALAHPRLALIHGPPGTGKTRVLGRVLHALVADGERPWALADSNAAVDHLALEADAQGLDVVRVGSVGRIGSRAARLGLEVRMAKGPYGRALELLERELMRETDRATRRRLGEDIRDLRRTARTHVLEGADVIACTLGTLLRRASTLPEARTAVIDEATQAIEPLVWSVVPWVERMVLVGDPHQLGPVVIDPGNSLETSILSRLLSLSPAPMLEVQHRMSEDLQWLVGDRYGPAYRPHPSVKDHRLSGLPGVQDGELSRATAVWVDTAGAGWSEEQDPVTASFFNAQEAALIVHVATQLRALGVADLGIIAPYSAQVARISSALPDVEVATVNAFQGREKAAILVSFVRSNDAGETGFVSDPRRLTVAVTRARCLLVCVGDSATLARAPGFAELVAAIEDLGGLQTVWEPPWSELGDPVI